MTFSELNEIIPNRTRGLKFPENIGCSLISDCGDLQSKCLVVIPFSVTVSLRASIPPVGSIYACCSIIGGGGGQRDVKAKKNILVHLLIYNYIHQIAYDC